MQMKGSKRFGSGYRTGVVDIHAAWTYSELGELSSKIMRRSSNDVRSFFVV